MAIYLEVIEDIKEDIKTPSEFHLYLSESYTNRFNPSISIKNAIPDTQNVNSTKYCVL